MKKITCLLVVLFFFSQQNMAQGKKPTAQPAIPQMPDIEKMMKDLPADEQKMVKEMLNNTSGSVVTKKDPVKKTTSPIVEIKIKQPLQVPTEAQAKEHLLWYKGKKINDSMLVTPKAMLVLYSNKRNMVIAQPLEKTDSFRLMVKNIAKQAKMTEDYIGGEAKKKNSFLNYPLIQMTVDQFEAVDEQFNNTLKNTIDLPEVPINNTAPRKPKGPSADYNLTPEQGIREMHSKLKTLLANEPDKNFDAPPKDQFGVSYHCDKNALKLYREAEDNWNRKFHEYEVDLLRSAMGVARALQLFDYKESDINASFPGLNDDIQKAQDRYFSRLDEKISKLISSYGKNIFMQPCIIRTLLAHERQKQLFGRSDEGEKFWLEFSSLIEGPELENYVNEQIDKKNWDVILDLPYMLGRQRQAQLLGAEDLSKRLEKLTDKLINLNRFALTIDIDFNERYHDDDGEDVLKVNGSIKTTDKVYVSLFPVGCTGWILTIPTFDYTLGLPYFPLQVVSGLKSVKNDKAWQNYSYSGPKDMIMYSPAFAIDFTRTNEQDTAVLQLLRYVDDLPPIPVDNAYTTDLTGYLSNMYVKPKETGDKEQKIIDYGKDMLVKFSKITSAQNNTTTLEKLKSQHSLMTQKQAAAREASELINTAQAVILFNAQNGSSTLIDVKMDTKHKTDELEVIYGIFKLKVVNDPIPEN